MDTSQHKLTNTSWETYNLVMPEHDESPFDYSQWPYFLPLQNPNSASHSPAIHGQAAEEELDEAEEELGAMKEMMFKIAAMQPVDIDPAAVRKPRRRNVRISGDPQSIAARHRRERISEKIRILQRLVPGGTKMDTASMLDEAIRYVKFLKRQIRTLQGGDGGGCHYQPPLPPGLEIPAAATSSYLFGGSSDDGAARDDSRLF